MRNHQYNNLTIKQFNNRKGITLIEMVAIIVVFGLAIPVLLTMWADVAWRSGRSEALADATFYAQQLTEEIKSKRFDEKDSPPWTSNLGPESGESRTGTGDSAFDDVDDYIISNEPISGTLGYTYTVAIDYVRLGANNIWESCGSISCSNISDCTNCQACCYKRIRVSVSRVDNLVKDASLITIVSAY